MRSTTINTIPNRRGFGTGPFATFALTDGHFDRAVRQVPVLEVFGVQVLSFPVIFYSSWIFFVGAIHTLFELAPPRAVVSRADEPVEVSTAKGADLQAAGKRVRMVGDGVVIVAVNALLPQRLRSPESDSATASTPPSSSGTLSRTRHAGQWS